MKISLKLNWIIVLLIIFVLSSCNIKKDDSLKNIELLENHIAYYNNESFFYDDVWYECSYTKVNKDSKDVEKTTKYIIGKFEFNNGFICNSDTLYFEKTSVIQKFNSNVIESNNEKFILKNGIAYYIDLGLDQDYKIVNNLESVIVQFPLDNFYERTKELKQNSKFINVDVIDYRRLVVEYSYLSNELNYYVSEEYVFDQQMKIIQIVKTIVCDKYQEIYMFNEYDRQISSNYVFVPNNVLEEVIVVNDDIKIDF